MDTIVIGGGQSGLAAARALIDVGLKPLVLEAGEQAVGSWPAYYDSLTLFSPARYSSLPGRPFPGDPSRYPTRDEVIAYLAAYAEYVTDLGAEMRTRTRVAAVEAEAGGFRMKLDDGETLTSPSLIAATGSFGNPSRLPLPGYFGRVIHAAEYVNPDSFQGKRVIVVGGGNSAVQIADELAGVARVSLATRKPIRFVNQEVFGRNLHFWFTVTGFDRWPVNRAGRAPTAPVLDDGRYRGSLGDGRMDRRPMFTGLYDEGVIWSDGNHEKVDVIVLAIGYRPDLPYLAGLGALDDYGVPRQRHGVSATHPRLGYLGLEWQRTPASNSLRGVGRDAGHLARRLRSLTSPM